MPGPADLVVLTADKDQEHAVRGLVTRSAALGIRKIAFHVVVHPQKDPGCLTDSAEVLRLFIRTHDKALVVFDRKGCGRDATPREDLERLVEGRMAANGWAKRAAAVAIDPELEAWVWSDSSEIDDVLGWRGASPTLREWLAERGLWHAGDPKPPRPKEACHEALRHAGKARSSALFEALALRVSVTRCVDPAFRKLRETLVGWFPA